MPSSSRSASTPTTPHKDQFARAVTYKTEYAQSLIDDFSKKEKAPHIAISVDMLDTGIDVPEVVIPAIKAEAALIHAVAGDDWWEDVTVRGFEPWT